MAEFPAWIEVVTLSITVFPSLPNVFKPKSTSTVIKIHSIGFTQLTWT